MFQCCRDVDNDGEATDFNEANVTDLFNFEEKLTVQKGDISTKNVDIMKPLKYRIIFWRTLERPLINFEGTLDLNLSENSVIVATNAAHATKFPITDTTLYVSTVYNTKLLEQ